MNRYDENLMGKPDAIGERCTIPGCGSAMHLERHHIVPRSRGGHDGPLRTLCWTHHEMVRLRCLHFDWRDGWEFLITQKPTKQDAAIESHGWREC